MKIGNNEYTKNEILARIGRMGQLGGIKRYTLTEGFEAGSEIIEVDTGSGLRFLISPSKGMDIVAAEYCGSSLNWQGVNGVVNPAFYKPEGLGWLDSSSSGLLMTCGFSNVGSPCEDEGVSYGLHGEAHNIPAKEVSAISKWIDDECYITVSGVIEEHKMFGHHIALKRKITACLGVNNIKVEDTVENLGAESVPFMLLYHCNFGFPLLTEKTRIELPSKNCVPREPDLEPAPALWREPQAGFSEQVYLCKDIQTLDNLATAKIYNPEFPVGSGTIGLEMNMTWDTTNLPELIQWYMPGCSTHALGIEPANCGVHGRAATREQGKLNILEVNETKNHMVQFSVITN